MKSKFTIGVFAAIFDEQNRILCVKRNYADKKWTTPGGAMEHNESPFEALIREVKEETGYIINPDSLRHISTYSSKYKDDLVLAIRAEIIGREDWQPDNEISEVGFFAEDSLPEMREGTLIRINDAFSNNVGVLRVFDQQL